MEEFISQNLMLILGLFITLILGTYFSAAEMAFSSLNRARIKSIAESESGKKVQAEKVAKLYEEHFDEVISTLLIWNNTVAITSATISVALFVQLLGEWGYFVSTVIISAVVIVLTDIFPKSLSKESPEKVAMWCVPLLQFLVTIMRPINWVIMKMKDGTGIGKDDTSEMLDPEEQVFREQELIFMAREAAKDGAMDEEETELITNAIEFKDISVSDIITPRVDVISVPNDATVDDVLALFLEAEYSRIVVYEDSLDHIKGVIHLRDFLRLLAQKNSEHPLQLEDVIKPAVFTIPNARISDVLQLFKKEHTHLAVVSDEHGGTEGIVTMDDILERLVGDIWDEHDEVVEEFLLLPNGKYRILGTSYISDLFDFLNIKAESESSTVGGWIMDELRRVPEIGDVFEFENLIVSVTNADARRVKECEINVIKEK
ncbi:MAG: hemolysin family protein [Turicibacter sp.]|nr:hemolysin family protein [Turicibacter sp.]